MIQGPPRKKTRQLQIAEMRRLLARPGTPRTLRRDRKAWQRLVRAGMWGYLAEYLGLDMHRWGPGDALGTLPPRERWGHLQADLTKSFPPGTLQSHIVGAMLESLILARYGFIPAWCSHGKHWFISDDRRREDCPEHRIAGQRARYRENPGVQEKERRQRVQRRGRKAQRSGRW